MPPRSTADDRSRYLKALGDPERLKIVEHLQAGPKSVGQLSRELDNRIANVSHHLGLLKDAGVVVARKKGRFVIYELSAAVRGSGEASSLDFGCCRIDLDGRHPASDPPTTNEALRQINRILSRIPEVTRPIEQRVQRKPTIASGRGGREIAIENPSFEQPATAFFDMAVEGWIKEGDPSATGVFLNAQDDTPFPGSRFVTNADGRQLAAMAARNPGGSAGPATLSQALKDRYQEATTYEVSLAIGVSSVQPPAAPAGGAPPVIRFALTFSDHAGTRHELAGLSVSTAQLAGEGTDAATRLQLFSFAQTLAPKSPAVSRPIEILITTAPNGADHDGHFVFDDVRLTARSAPSNPRKQAVSQRSNGR